jgi:hypothetical protein
MEETVLGPSGPASVVFDIGGDIGALVVYLPDDLLGGEVEIFPVGRDVALTHTSVRARHLGGREIVAAVYPALPEGSYHLAGSEEVLVIEGGSVTEATIAHAHTHSVGGEVTAHVH